MFFKEFDLPKGPVFPSYTVNIKDIGATEGIIATDIINGAIKKVSENGGGHVVIPSGRWTTGAIRLMSNVDLHFEEGSFVSFDPTPENYLPAVLTMYEGIRCINYSPLIYGCGLENVAVTGADILRATVPNGGNGRKTLLVEIYFTLTGAPLRSAFTQLRSLRYALCSYRF